MILRITLMLLLSGASLPLLANEGRMESPDGDPGCPSVTGVDERELAPDGGQVGDAEAASGERATPARRDGGNAESGARTPRMHNLLPGMFR